MLPLQILENDAPVCVEPPALSVDERLVPQVALINQVTRTEVADDAAVDANAGMHEEEGDEVLVVVQTHAVVDPDAMMVKLLAAHVAQSAVLGASRLGCLAGVAPTLGVEHAVVVVVALYGAFNFVLGHAWLDEAWVGAASEVVGVVAREHKGDGDVLVVVVNIGVGDVFEAIGYVEIVASHSQKQVHDLDGRICLVADVGLGTLHEPDYFLATGDFSYA